MEIILKKDGVTALADTHGAELHSYLLATGREVLWGGSAESWKGRSPVLFPIVGTLAKNQTTIGGKCYSMKSHGFARNLEFEVAQQTESSVTFVLRADNETRAQYPFEFALFITHELTAGGFRTSYRIENHSAVSMPCSIGGHVGFRCPMEDGKFDDFELSWADHECVLLFPYDTPAAPEPLLAELLVDSCRELDVSHALFDLGTLLMLQPQNSIITLQNPKSGVGVRMEYEGFPVLALWSKEYANAPFLCIEPWHGVPDLVGETGRMEDKRFMMSLAPGEEKLLSYTVTVLERSQEDG